MEGADSSGAGDAGRGSDLAMATVFADGREMGYRQGGRGRVVVLLTPTDRSTELAGVLVPRFRVIVPDAPPTEGGATFAGSDGPGSLRGFLDGIGLKPIHLVTNGTHLESVLRFSAFDPERVAGVVLVRDPRDRPGTGRTAFLEGLRDVGIPILDLGEWSGADRSPGPWLEHLLGFLEGSAAG